MDVASWWTTWLTFHEHAVPVNGKATVGIVCDSIGNCNFDSVSGSCFYRWPWKLTCGELASKQEKYAK